MREKEKKWERENAWISVMWLPKFLLVDQPAKCVCYVLEMGCAKKKKTNCGNIIVEIGEEKKNLWQCIAEIGKEKKKWLPKSGEELKK